MRSFTIILFVFFAFFLAISLFVVDPLPFFIVIFLAFLICFICLASYLGKLRGLTIGIIFIILPFLIEYYAYKYQLPFAGNALIRNLNFNRINLPITLNNLFTIFTVPLLFLSSLFFAYKIKLLTNLKTYHKTFLIISGSLLVAINFLSLTDNQAQFQNFFKWLIIALIVNSLTVWLYKFKPETKEIYKELPIILYLTIYGTNAFKQADSFQLFVTIILTICYLMLLYNEYKIKKIKAVFPF